MQNKSKVIKILVLLIAIVFIPNAYAANYEIKELIPVGIQTTVVSKHLSYRGISYNTLENKITFNSVKNISKEAIPFSISIGLFDKNRENIGILNVCTKDTILNADEEVSPSIMVDEAFIANKKSYEDIRYIAVLEDNITCKINSSIEEVGKKVDDIGKTRQSVYKGETKNFINIFVVIFGGLLVLFIYQFMFTNKYRNMDGKDVRRAMKTKKKKHKKVVEVPKEDPNKIKNTTKSEEMAKKEEIENQKSKNQDNDLMNMYK